MWAAQPAQGARLQRIRPQMVAGSVFLQLQPEGKACY
jgi:hypothetical protein